MKKNWENKYKPENIDNITTNRDVEQKKLYDSLGEKLVEPGISYEEQAKALSETIDNQLELMEKTRDEIFSALEEHKNKRVDEQTSLGREDVVVTDEYMNDEINYKKTPFFLFSKKKELKEKMEHSKEKYEKFRLKKRESDKLKMGEEEKKLADELDKKVEEAEKLKKLPFYKFTDKQKLKKLREEIEVIYKNLLKYRSDKFDMRSDEEKSLSNELQQKTEEFSTTPRFNLIKRKNKREELSDAYQNLLNFRNRDN